MSLKVILLPEIRAKIFKGFLLDFGPIILFLILVRPFGFYTATFSLMLATIISTIFSFRKDRKIPYFALYVAGLTLIFGWITISYQDTDFIQIRDTIYDLSLATTLIIGLIFKTNLLKLAFGGYIELHLRTWNKLAYSWILFFLINGILNEYVRRFFDDYVWINFKTGMLFFTIIFGIVTLLFFYEHDDDK